MPDLRHHSDRVLEPGIYVSAGGVRHSDILIITQAGSECITFGPKDLTARIVWQP